MREEIMEPTDNGNAVYHDRNQPHILLQELVTLFQSGNHAEAKKLAQYLTERMPNHPLPWKVLGVLFRGANRISESLPFMEMATKLSPEDPEAHCNLGSTLYALGRPKDAYVSYSRALKINPNYTPALLNRWQLLFDTGNFEAALSDIDRCDTESSRACGLETLYALGRIEEIYNRIEKYAVKDGTNIRMAAFAAFISTKENRPTAHNFCQDPFSFIRISNLGSYVSNLTQFIQELITEVNQVPSVWEPALRSTSKGSQTAPHLDLFKIPSKVLANLQTLICKELDAYYLKFSNADCSFIRKWPRKKILRGWHVVLKPGGFQTSHIHTNGWLSGVIYLKVVPSAGANEGAIEFSLNSDNYYDSKSQEMVFNPSRGDIVLFPSNLYHRTIPFTSNEERIIVSFDLYPDED